MQLEIKAYSNYEKEFVERVLMKIIEKTIFLEEEVNLLREQKLNKWRQI